VTAATGAAPDRAASGGSTVRTAGVWAIGLAVSAGCIYLTTREISVDAVRESLASVRWALLVPSLLLIYLALLLRAVRWRLLFRDPHRVGLGPAVASVNIGLMFNNILPARAGEIPRVLALRRSTGVSAVEAASTIVVERILDVFVLGLLGVALAPWLPDETWIRLLVALCVAIVVFLPLLALGIVLMRTRLPSLLVRLTGAVPRVSDARAQQAVASLASGATIFRRPRRLLAALLLGAGAWAAGGLAIWVLMPAFDLPSDTLAPWLVLLANALAVTVPSSPGTVGVYEASVQYSLVAFGADPSVALSYAIVLHALNFLPVVLTGLLASWLVLWRPRDAGA
jgi:uncharacterized protein (TIRG00374 family)